MIRGDDTHFVWPWMHGKISEPDYG